MDVAEIAGFDAVFLGDLKDLVKLRGTGYDHDLLDQGAFLIRQQGMRQHGLSAKLVELLVDLAAHTGGIADGLGEGQEA